MLNGISLGTIDVCTNEVSVLSMYLPASGPTAIQVNKILNQTMFMHN